MGAYGLARRLARLRCEAQARLSPENSLQMFREKHMPLIYACAKRLKRIEGLAPEPRVATAL